MKTNEETVFGTVSQTKKEEKKLGQSWKAVSIGGVTGILMGATGMFAADTYAAERKISGEDSFGENTDVQETSNSIKVAEVDQSLSFGEAFEVARQEVGAGGVFHWHGGIYNTYTAEEWNNMTPDERAHFSQQVQPEIRPDEQHAYVSHHDTSHHHDQTSVTESKKEEESQDNSGHGEQTHEEHRSDEPEVHFLGVESIQTNSGSTINVGHMTIAEQEVAVVDLDNDMVFDVAVSDRNQNGEIDDNEVIDISSQQMTVTDFALASAQETGSSNSNHPDLASNQQDHIADDMPDYMNDVDVNTI